MIVMNLVIPCDIRAEVINNYLGATKKDISFIGNHNRNAYKDVASISQVDETIKVELSKQGLYDILPEALFHPIDRFENIPANEYKERFAEEVEQQRSEEINARAFFSLYDNFIFGLSSVVVDIKQKEYCDNRILSEIICDSLPQEYKTNRFINRTKEFIPQCKNIRGDVTKISLMLRKVMADEGLKLEPNISSRRYTDEHPKYSCQVAQEDDEASEVYLGNTFDENMLSYDIYYWDDNFCDKSFLKFVHEIRSFEEFLNDYFMGVETSICFNISTRTLPVRLSDEMLYNYLDYNTNI